MAEYALLLALAYAVPVAIAVSHRSPSALLPLLTLPLAVPLLRAVARERGRDLNRRLGGTARLLLLHGIGWAVGLGLVGRLP